MAMDLLQFVDSISATPTVRLDLNDGATWGADVTTLDFSPPPLRRAINGTLLTDGSVMSASSYDNRICKVQVDVLAGSLDLTAAQVQLLNRELDRDTNYLKWQPAGATSPVFFHTMRSPVTAAYEVPGNGTYKRFQLEILAEPFALGLREDVAVGTVNNDPAAGSNGLFFDITGVKGDVAAPVVIKDATSFRALGILASRQHGTPSDLVFFGQAEAMSFGTDTLGGGSTDVVMSGAANPNFARTSFATTAAQAVRLTWVMGGTTAQRLAFAGTYRIFVCVRRGDATSVITIANANLVNTNNVTVPLTTARQLVDIGLWNPLVGPVNPGRYGADAPVRAQNLQLYAARNSGTGTLDWDFVLLVPADEQFMIWDAFSDAVSDGIIDSPNESVYTDDTTGGAIFGGTVGTFAGVAGPALVSGGFPTVKPNQASRFFIAWGTSVRSGTGIQHDKTKTGSLTVSYWPRYLYVRPATT